MDTKHCTICGEDKPLDKFTRNPDGSIRKHVCKACYGKKYKAQLKLEVLEAFGWVCKCCGEAHPYFLCLDHVKGDGAEHRAKYDSSNNHLIWADAKREGFPKDKYQILCFNCNSAKNYYGRCPHEAGLTPEEVIGDLASKVFHTGKSLQNMNLEPLKLGPLAQRTKRVEVSSMSPEERAKQLIAGLSSEQIKQLLQGP